jgi:hypothetical protein
MPFDPLSKRRRPTTGTGDDAADGSRPTQRAVEAGQGGAAAIKTDGALMSGSAMMELQRTAGNQAASSLVIQRDEAADDSWEGSIKGNLSENPVVYHSLYNNGGSQRDYVMTVSNTGYTQLLFKTRFVFNGQEQQEWTQIAPTHGETLDAKFGLPPKSSVSMRFIGERDARTPDQVYVAGSMKLRRTK